MLAATLHSANLMAETKCGKLTSSGVLTSH
jgi:hypothetical protein